MSPAMIHQAWSSHSTYSSALLLGLMKGIFYASHSATPMNPNKIRCGIGLSPNFISE